MRFVFFCFNDTATTEIYTYCHTLSLHDALPLSIDDGWEVVDGHPMTGIAGGQDQSLSVPMWVVDDIETAVERVRAAGGMVIEGPARQSYAISAECLDDQGSPFWLAQY